MHKLTVLAPITLLFIFVLFMIVSEDMVCSHGPNVYTWERLLALRNTVMLPEERPEIPCELRSRKRR